jgi:hypothetical protein
VPDVLLYFSTNLVPLQGGLTVSNIVALPSFLQSSAATFAAFLGVPPTQLYAVNVTDLATGAFVPVGSVRRQLAGTGSKGVAVTYVVRLGKTPTEAQVTNISAVLSSPTIAAATLKAVTAQLGAATQLGAAAFAVSVPAAGVTLANSPFVLGSTVVVAASGDGASGSSSTGGIVGGIICALALACGIWAGRSYSKHGVLPCCRDRKRETLTRKSELSEAAEVERALFEAESALERKAAAAAAASNSAVALRVAAPPQRPTKSKSAVVKQLIERAESSSVSEARAAKAEAELAALRAQLAAAKGDDDADAEELAALRAQLRAAKAAKAAAALEAAQQQQQQRQGFEPLATQNPAFAPR